MYFTVISFVTSMNQFIGVFVILFNVAFNPARLWLLRMVRKWYDWQYQMWGLYDWFYNFFYLFIYVIDFYEILSDPRDLHTCTGIFKGFFLYIFACMFRFSCEFYFRSSLIVLSYSNWISDSSNQTACLNNNLLLYL